MKFVKHAVRYRCDDDADGCDENDPADECIQRSEPFARIRGNGVGRPHAGKDHRSIEQTVEPGETAGVVIADNSGAKEKKQDDQPGQYVAHQAVKENPRGHQRRMFVLEMEKAEHNDDSFPQI